MWSLIHALDLGGRILDDLTRSDSLYQSIRCIGGDDIAQADTTTKITIEGTANQIHIVFLQIFVEESTGYTQRQFVFLRNEGNELNGLKPRGKLLLAHVGFNHLQTICPQLMCYVRVFFHFFLVSKYLSIQVSPWLGK